MNEPFTSTASEAETVDAFVRHLSENGWFLEMSQGSKPRMLNARANQSACFDELSFQFDDWLKTQPARVCKIDKEFRERLPYLASSKLTRVYGVSFRPTSDKSFYSEGGLMANIYVPFMPTGKVCPDGMALLDELADRVWPMKDDKKTCLQFFAHVLRHPTVRPQWALLITGQAGTGKSFMVKLVETAMGRRACWREDDFGKALKQYSEVLPNNLLVTFDDAPAKQSIYEQMKHPITSDFQEVELKHAQRRRLREVYARIVILTNDPRPFDLTDDRRLYVPRYCTHKVDKAESDQFFRRLTEWAESPNCAATVRAWLDKIDLSDFDTVSPRITDAHRAMSEKASSEVAEMIAAYVADERIVHVTEVAHHLVGLGQRKPSCHEIEKALASANYASRRRPHPRKRGQVQLWVPSARRRGRALTPSELERMEAAGAFR